MAGEHHIFGIRHHGPGCARSLVAALEALARAQPLILLDYETNCDVDDLRRPLSHAGLVAAHLRERLAAA
ncbi:MAG: hypothetical protein KC420_06655 [Myxococcales bacterium]|nr:hypothetical protein [Myxococcales bacterium]